jgi:hypothetical protein
MNFSVAGKHLDLSPTAKACFRRALPPDPMESDKLGEGRRDQMRPSAINRRTLMHRTFVALGCALALAGGSALAQQQNSGASSSGSNNSSGGSFTDKAKQAAQTIGEKTKEAAEKAKDKVAQSSQGGQSGQSGQSSKQSQSMGASGSSGSSANDPKQMQKQADADFKSAKAQCEPIQQKSQKTLCEKQATAAHANAEVDIEKAKATAQGGNTSSMGAGKASQ